MLKQQNNWQFTYVEKSKVDFCFKWLVSVQKNNFKNLRDRRVVRVQGIIIICCQCIVNVFRRSKFHQWPLKQQFNFLQCLSFSFRQEDVKRQPTNECQTRVQIISTVAGQGLRKTEKSQGNQQVEKPIE